jgi:cell division protein FtsB
VDAGGEPLLDERARDALADLRGWRRREHDDEVGHGKAGGRSHTPAIGVYFSTEILYCLLGMAAAERGSRSRRALAPTRRPGRTRRIVRVLILFVSAIIVVDAIAGDQGLLAMLRARRQSAELAAAIERQRAENERLREDVRRLTEDPAAIEEVARRELGLIRPGEKVFIIKDLTNPSTP